MKESKIAALALAGALTVSALAGCSGDAGDGASGGSGEKLTYMYRGSDAEKAAYQKAIDAFTAETGVEVEVIVTTADDYTTKLQAAITGGQAPDVFYLEQGSVQSFVNSGVVMDITDQVDELGIDLDNLWKFGVDSYRYDAETGLQGTPEGQLYALPKDVSSFVMGYNKTMLDAAGYTIDPDVPLTWDEWNTMMTALTKDTDGDGALDQWGTGLNVAWSIYGLAWSNGADWANEDFTEVTVDTPEMAEALQYFADMTNTLKVTPDATTAASMDTYQRWMAGEIAFFPVGPWDVPTYNTLDFEYD
ncbi:MAG: sugar ABC transporter substrate-binding protein, partial [Propionibacteriaceae bacterium]|nr:sugar ABC transporter substrate-binding protein [Propionibacteriaceae bacterium]